MEYDYIISKPPLDELYHHGILGQKWGKKNGPPYPLDSKKSTGKHLKISGSIKKKKSPVSKKDILPKAREIDKKIAEEYDKKLLSSSSYNKGFLDYIKNDVVKPEMVDDPELMELIIMEYEESTGKKAMKD